MHGDYKALFFDGDSIYPGVGRTVAEAVTAAHNAVMDSIDAPPDSQEGVMANTNYSLPTSFDTKWPAAVIGQQLPQGTPVDMLLDKNASPSPVPVIIVWDMDVPVGIVYRQS